MRIVIFGVFVAFLAAAAVRAEGVRVGVGAGYVDPSDVGGSIWFTGNTRFHVASNVVVEPELGYWQKSESYQGLVDASVKDFDFGANVLYVFPSKSSVSFWAGAGLGAHVLKGEVGAPGFAASDSETKLGGQLLAGLDYEVGSSIALFGAARYDLVSDFNQFKLYAGLRFGGR